VILPVPGGLLSRRGIVWCVDSRLSTAVVYCSNILGAGGCISETITVFAIACQLLRALVCTALKGAPRMAIVDSKNGTVHITYDVEALKEVARLMRGYALIALAAAVRGIPVVNCLSWMLRLRFISARSNMTIRTLSGLTAIVIQTSRDVYGTPVLMNMVGVQDRCVELGAPWELMRELELTAEYIVQRAVHLQEARAE